MFPFNENILLEADSAKQDKIELEIGSWQLIGDSQHTQTFFLQSLSELELPEGLNLEGLRWFRNRQINTGSYVTFRNQGPGSQSQIGKPLIAGEIRVRRVPSSHGEACIFRVSAKIKINPTRFARYHAVRIRRQVFNSAPVSPNSSSLITTDLASNISEVDEVVLDGNDNVLLTRRSLGIASRSFWHRLVNYYWINILDFLENSFQQACDGRSYLERSSGWRINLKFVETYWEFSHDHAIEALSSIKSRLKVFGRENQQSNYPVYVEGRHLNSPTFKVQLTNGVHVVVYAKTNKRIRIEFRHKLYGPTGSASVIGGGHTNPSPEVLHDWLRFCAEDAAERGNSMLDYIQSSEWESSSQRPLYTFLSAIVDVCDDVAQYDLILSLLVNNGVIYLQRGDPLRQVINALIDQRILQRTNRSAYTFGVHPNFSMALEQLQLNSR